jgi:autotransporter-associated beta strand protein
MMRSLAIVFFSLIFALISSRASSIAWSPNPVSGDWYTPENWIPQIVPNGPNDRAIFNSSSITNVSFPALSETRLDRMVFASAGFNLDVSAGATVTLDGAGILGGVSITVSGQLKFLNYAANYSHTGFGVSGGNPGGTVLFYGHSSSAPILSYSSGLVEYHDRSQAAGTSWELYPDDGVNPAAVMTFSDEAKADGASFGAATSSNQTVGPTIYLDDDSTAKGTTFLLSDISVIDISGHNAPGVTIGTLLLRGQVYLGTNNLSVIDSNTSPFYGSIHDGGASGGTGGSLTLLADNNPSFTLSGASDYTGGTVVEGGILLAASSGTGSVTGAGPVQVNGGGLGGHGVIAGAVTIGTGTGTGASLSPGIHLGGGQTLTMRQSLTFASDATFEASVNSEMVTANSVATQGVTIASGAQLTLTDVRASTLPVGTTFTVIDNTAANPIAGTFSNLPDGATITAGANTFQASYEGGDGNDLTLTVVP